MRVRKLREMAGDVWWVGSVLPRSEGLGCHWLIGHRSCNTIATSYISNPYILQMMVSVKSLSSLWTTIKHFVILLTKGLP